MPFTKPSNKSLQNVYFDDITIYHKAGPLLQEQSYYPYGVQMHAISDKAALNTTTPYKYNGDVEYEEDGVDYYNTFYRKYDAQIGRFTGVDIYAEVENILTPDASAFDRCWVVY
jgi:RHS repeat-associated protein